MERIAITSPDAVVAVLPYVVGYRLDNAAVIAWTRDDLLVLTQRIDLPEAELDEAIVRTELVEPALRSQPTAATIVLTGHGGVEDRSDWPDEDSDDDPDDDWPDDDERREAAQGSGQEGSRRRLPHRQLVQVLQAAIGAANIEVLDAIYTANGRWWSYLCEQACCPPQGRVVDPEAELVLRARFALEGIAPLDSRNAVAAQYRPDVNAHRRVAPRLQAAIAEVDGLDDAARVAWRLAQLSGPCADITRPQASDIDDDVIAELACALRDARVRDSFVIHLANLPALGPVVGALAAAVRATPPGYLAPVATCAGIAAWLHGDGARATIALELARDDEPTYELAELVHAAVTHGLPPWEWRESMLVHLAA